MKNSTATIAVSRVRLRSTMCVPPCERRREAHAAEARVAPGVHEDQRHERRRDEDVEDSEEAEHAPKRSPSSPPGARAAILGRVAARGRRPRRASTIQKLILTGDNRLKQGVDPAKVRESYEQALALAREAGIEERIRPLVEVRLADLEQLAAESASTRSA